MSSRRGRSGAELPIKLLSCMATVLYRVPAFLTAAGVYDWAEEGNVDRLPIDKMPSVLRTVSHFTYDGASRQLGMFFTNTVGISESTQVILPDFLVAADVVGLRHPRCL